MRVELLRTLPAPPEAVWRVLEDPRRLASLVPGTENVGGRGDAWTADAGIPLGIGTLRIALSFQLVEADPPRFARVVTEGVGSGMVLAMESEIRLEPSDGGSATAVRLSGDVVVTGPSGSMGRRVLAPIVEQQAGLVLAALEHEAGQVPNARR